MQSAITSYRRITFRDFRSAQNIRSQKKCWGISRNRQEGEGRSICKSIKTRCNDRCFVRDTRYNRDDFKQNRNDARKICRKKKRKMVSKERVSLQNKNYKKEQQEMHKNVNYLHTQHKPRNRNFRKQNWSMLTEEVQIIESWKNIFKLINKILHQQHIMRMKTKIIRTKFRRTDIRRSNYDYKEF